MTTEQDKLKNLLHSLPKPPLPNGLEQRVLFAVRKEKEARARKNVYWRRVFLTTSFALFVATFIPVLMTISRDNFYELITTAITNYRVIGFTNVIMAIMENLPLENIAFSFVAIFIYSYFLSKKNTNKLSLKLSLS